MFATFSAGLRVDWFRWRHLFLAIGVLAAAALVVVSACADDPEPQPQDQPQTSTPPVQEQQTGTQSMSSAEQPEQPEPQLGTIVEIASDDDRFQTLVTAVVAAGLAETLQGEGPFTVFAPTDEAFAALPEGALEALLEDIPALTDILLYHVVAGAVTASDVVELESALTVQGEALTITLEGGVVRINEARVAIADIEASNGVIHVIDQVLIPPEQPEQPEPQLGTIVEIASDDDRFQTLVTAVVAAGLAETLQGEGPFTVFAPTDEAFAALPEGALEALLEDIPALTDILLYHVVAGAVTASDVVELESALTVQGEALTITLEGGVVRINEARVVIADIEASNGVIHVIDQVLIPPEQ